MKHIRYEITICTLLVIPLLEDKRFLYSLRSLKKSSYISCTTYIFIRVFYKIYLMVVMFKMNKLNKYERYKIK